MQSIARIAGLGKMPPSRQMRFTRRRLSFPISMTAQLTKGGLGMGARYNRTAIEDDRLSRFFGFVNPVVDGIAVLFNVATAKECETVA